MARKITVKDAVSKLLEKERPACGDEEPAKLDVLLFGELVRLRMQDKKDDKLIEDVDQLSTALDFLAGDAMGISKAHSKVAAQASDIIGRLIENNRQAAARERANAFADDNETNAHINPLISSRMGVDNESPEKEIDNAFADMKIKDFINDAAARDATANFLQALMPQFNAIQTHFAGRGR